MPDPITERVSETQMTSGRLGMSGLTSFRKKLGDRAVASSFNVWARDPMTQTVRSAIRDMAMRHPSVASPDNIAVQYGVTMGLDLAYRLMSDPSSVFPELFADAGMGEQVALEETYDTPPYMI